MKQIQQGDVLFQQINKLPDGLKQVSPRNGRIVLAEGETTGHHHAITATKTKSATLYELTNNGRTKLYLEVTSPVVVEHEEHKAQTIPEGIYKVGQVLEYDYFAEQERLVRD
jgi:hypothetical protein